MEYNENQNLHENENTHVYENQAPELKEKTSNGNSLWWWLLALLILGLIGWYGYTSGWFSSKKNLNSGPLNEKSSQEEKLGLLGDGVYAPISNVVIETSEGFPVQKTLVVKGDLPDSCIYLNEPQTIRDGNIFYVNLTTRKEGDMCTEALVPYERNIGLDVVGLPAGVYTVVINGKQMTFELEQDNTIDFTAGAEK
jgi:hypothetical protein